MRPECNCIDSSYRTKQVNQCPCLRQHDGQFNFASTAIILVVLDLDKTGSVTVSPSSYLTLTTQIEFTLRNETLLQHDNMQFNAATSTIQPRPGS